MAIGSPNGAWKRTVISVLVIKPSSISLDFNADSRTTLTRARCPFFNAAKVVCIADKNTKDLLPDSYHKKGIRLLILHDNSCRVARLLLKQQIFIRSYTIDGGLIKVTYSN